MIPLFNMINPVFKYAPLDQNQVAQLKGVKIGFATMPPEVRIKIMENALVMEKGVKIRRDGNDNDDELPGAQLLATCQQFYVEGCEMFYQRNVFFLPPGPLQLSNQYFTTDLHHRHRHMITHYCIQLSFQDLTLELWEKSQSFFRQAMVARPELLSEEDFELSDVESVWAIRGPLCRLWASKIHLLSGMSSMTETCIESVEGERMHVSPSEINAACRFMEAVSETQITGRRVDTSRDPIRCAFRKSATMIQDEVGVMLTQTGSESTMEWMKRGCSVRFADVMKAKVQMCENAMGEDFHKLGDEGKAEARRISWQYTAVKETDLL